MDQHVVAFGYIETDPAADEHNRRILKAYHFTPRYPRAMDLFSDPRAGHDSSLISFAAEVGDLDQEWEEWQKRFEKLLGRLCAYNARIHLHDESNAEICCLTYWCDEDWEHAQNGPGHGPDSHPKRRWIRSLAFNGCSRSTVLL